MDVTSPDQEPGGTPAASSDPSAPQVPSDRDVAQVDPAQYPMRTLPRIGDLRGKGFQAVMTRSALNDMHRHGRSEPDVEVCGVIVGNVYHDDNGPYLYVEASIKGDHAAGKTAQVTFTADTWTHINDELEKYHPGKKILGWYHTHPGFGIFLSEMDLFIQNNFFPEPWQAAYVYDPKSGEDGIFLWKSGQATRSEFLVDPDTINTDPPRHAMQAAEPSSGTLTELTGRVQTVEHKVRMVVAALVIVAALAVAFPLILPLIQPSFLDRPQPPSRNESTEPRIPETLRTAPVPSTAPAPAPSTAPAPMPEPIPAGGPPIDPVSVEGPS